MSAFGYPFDLGVSEAPETCAHGILKLSCSNSPRASEVSFWLQNGLVWYYAFNHEEAIVCFENALALDRECAMAHWGISISHGPNYNTPKMSRDSFPSARSALLHAAEALRLCQLPSVKASLLPLEVDLIEALRVRYNPLDSEDNGELISQNTAEYAAALREVYRAHPDSACVASLYAEALMNFNPWHLWDLDSGLPAEHTLEIVDVVEHGLALSPMHIGLHHFKIHLVEMGPDPSLALPSCSVLRKCAPDAGHLIHMPSHIYVLMGMWQDAVDSNCEAQVADDKYAARAGSMNYYTGYRIHDMHFIAYAALFAGQFGVAMKAARDIQSTLSEEVLRNPELAQYYESFIPVDTHVLVRFGKWEEILAKTIPEDSKIWPMTRAVGFYAKGIALAVLGQVEAAEQAYQSFLTATREVPSNHVMHNNTCSSILAVGERMLAGEILYRQGYQLLAKLCSHHL